MSTTNLIAVRFTTPSEAYRAFNQVHGADRTGVIRVAQAAVVERTEDGQVKVLDGVNDTAGTGVITGGAVGSLVGILGGPLGMLFGLGAGALIGGVLDAGAADEAETALTAFSRVIEPGSTALVAEVDEIDPEFVDREMAILGGVVLRRSTDEVLTELEVAADAEASARYEADRVLKEQRKAERKQHREERKQKVHEKLHHD